MLSARRLSFRTGGENFSYKQKLKNTAILNISETPIIWPPDAKN